MHGKEYSQNPQNVDGQVIVEKKIMKLLDLWHPQNIRTYIHCTYMTFITYHAEYGWAQMHTQDWLSHTLVGMPFDTALLRNV